MSQRQTLTRLLQRWGEGDAGAFEELMRLTHSRLHRLADRYFRGERGSHTLQATAILNEAVLRLMDLDRLSWADRGHFFATAAQMMRRILVDHARARNRSKRGGEAVRVSLEEAEPLAVDGRPSDLEALDGALDALAQHDPLKAKIVELRFFAGLTGAEIAGCLGCSTATVQREWRRARTWLFLELKGERLDG